MLAGVYFVAWMLLSAVVTAPAISAALRFDPGQVLAQPWSLLTYTLVHDGFVHLSVLVGLLLLTGPGVAARMGWQRFLLYYSYCAVGGAAAAHDLAQHRMRRRRPDRARKLALPHYRHR